jgi:hypothetical protein
MRHSSLLILSAVLAAFLPLSAVRADPRPADDLGAGFIELWGNNQYVTGEIWHNGTVGIPYSNSAGRTATLEMRQNGRWVNLKTETLPAVIQDSYYITAWLPQPMRKGTIRLRLSPGDNNPGDDVTTRTFGYTTIAPAPALPSSSSGSIRIPYRRIVRR